MFIKMLKTSGKRHSVAKFVECLPWVQGVAWIRLSELSCTFLGQFHCTCSCFDCLSYMNLNRFHCLYDKLSHGSIRIKTSNIFFHLEKRELGEEFSVITEPSSFHGQEHVKGQEFNLVGLQLSLIHEHRYLEVCRQLIKGCQPVHLGQVQSCLIDLDSI